jgi:P4 family phage/plasmid primase-like protien
LTQCNRWVNNRITAFCAGKQHNAGITTMLEYYLDRGWRLTPIKNGDKRPEPKNWTVNTVNDWETVRRYPRDKSWGWVMDACHLVIDVDPRNGGLESLKKIAAKHDGPIVPSYPVVKTPTGGVHIYMSKPDDWPTRKQIPEYPGIDFLSIGAQVLTVGATHPKGGKYQFADKSPWQNGPQPAPQWLLNEIKKPEVEKKTTPAHNTALTPSQIKGLLDQLPVEDFRDHDSWLQIMQATHEASGGDALSDFLDWSLSDPSYSDQQDIIIQRWRSLHVGKSDGVTAGTLIKTVIDRGGSLPTPTAEEESELLPQLPPDLPGTVGDIIVDGRERLRCPLSIIEKKVGELPPAAKLDKIEPLLDLLKLHEPAERNRVLSEIVKKTGYKLPDLKNIMVRKIMEKTGSRDDIFDITTIALEKHFDQSDRITHAADQQFWIYEGTHWHPMARNLMSQRMMHAAQEWQASHPDRKTQLPVLVSQANQLMIARLASDIDFHKVRKAGDTIINCGNGELHIDGESGAAMLRPHDPQSFLTSCLPVDWKATAKCPRFELFLKEIFEPARKTDDVIRHLWELIGYTIQSKKNIASWVLLTGEGANGKTTLLNIIMALLGNAAIAASIPEIADSTHGLAELPGKLMMVDEDLKTKFKLPDGFIKKISENKIMRARPMYREGHQFENQAIIWMACNRLPVSDDLSHGMMRRAHVLHFGRIFSEDEQDKDLAPYIIKHELPGILRLAIEGLKRLRERGQWLMPEEIKMHIRSWSIQASPMALWIASVVERLTPNSGDGVLLRDAYSHFRLWASDQGMSHPTTKPMFRRALESAGYKFKTMSGNKLMIMDIALRKIEMDGE